MISALEAKKKVVLQTTAKKYMDEIEKEILKAVKDNRFATSVSYRTPIKNDVLTIILEELHNLGYEATYDPAKPCPSGCPIDQWSSLNYIRVSWE